MDRLSIDIGPVYALQLLSHQAHYVETDRGQAPCVYVRHNGLELEWVVAKKAFEQLQKYLGPASWAGRLVNITKIKENNYTRILVTPGQAAAPPVPPVPPPVQAVPPAEAPYLDPAYWGPPPAAPLPPPAPPAPAMPPGSPPPPPPEAPPPYAIAPAYPDLTRSHALQIIRYERPFSLEITKGQKGSYGFTLKVRSTDITALVDDAYTAVNLVNIMIEDLNGPPPGVPIDSIPLEET